MHDVKILEAEGEAASRAGEAPLGALAPKSRAREADLWVFAYGSLMWRPGFAYVERVSAQLSGYRRCFCIYSVHHRGTPQRPGLVLGLDRGGVCRGVAYRIASACIADTVAYLRAREQVTGVYREAIVPIRLLTEERPQVPALAYLVERAHPSYAGRLAPAVQARLIRGAQGISGGNLEYLVSTLGHLAELGIAEPELERVLNLAGRFVARGRDPLARMQSVRRATAREPIDVKTRRLRPGERKRFIHRKAFGTRGP